MGERTNLSMVDGELSANVAPDDRGLAYGHGLFETMRLSTGAIPLQDRHLARLVRDAERLHLPVDRVAVNADIERFIAHLKRAGITDGVVKLIITAGSGGRGYRTPKTLAARCILQYSALPNDLAALARTGARLYECEYRLPDNTTLAGIKHLNRLDQILARNEWQDNYDDGLMLDQKNLLVETTCANVFVRMGDEWLTPRLERAGIDGILRAFILNHLAPSNNLKVRECDLQIEDVVRCSEWFLCNSVRGIVPIIDLSGFRQWPVGDGTLRFSHALGKIYPCYL